MNPSLSPKQMLIIVLFCLLGLGGLLRMMGSQEMETAEQMEPPPTDLVSVQGKVVQAESNHQSSNRELYKVGYTYSVDGKRYAGEQWLSGSDFRRTCSPDPTIQYSKSSPDKGWVVPPDPQFIQSTGSGMVKWGNTLLFFSGSGLLLVKLASLASRKESVDFDA